MSYKDKYGAWAGNPNGRPPDLTRCCAEVPSPDGWRYSQCGRKRGHGPEGAYCKQHDPAAVAARKKAQEEKYIRDWNRHRYEIHGRTFFDALDKIANGHNDPRALASEVIAKFKEGER